MRGLASSNEHDGHIVDILQAGFESPNFHSSLGAQLYILCYQGLEVDAQIGFEDVLPYTFTLGEYQWNST